MNKKGMALLFGLLVIMVLFILYGAFFSKSISEITQAKRYVYSTKAFWAAEAGIADAIKHLPSSVNASIDGTTYATTTNLRTIILDANGFPVKYYDVVSTGTFTLPGGSTISRTVAAVVKSGPTDPSKFKFGLQAANNLCFGGGCKDENAPKYIIPYDTCPSPTGLCWNDEDPSINFQDMFNVTQDQVSAGATHYTQDTFPAELGAGVYWVDVEEGEELRFAGNGYGSGVLIVDGDAAFGAGTYNWTGIIYILGTFDVRGTFTATGSTIVASTSEIDDTINGTPEFHWDLNAIADALDVLSAVASPKTIVSWKEQ